MWEKGLAGQAGQPAQPSHLAWPPQTSAPALKQINFLHRQTGPPHPNLRQHSHMGDPRPSHLLPTHQETGRQGPHQQGLPDQLALVSPESMVLLSSWSPTRL